MKPTRAVLRDEQAMQAIAEEPALSLQSLGPASAEARTNRLGISGVLGKIATTDFPNIAGEGVRLALLRESIGAKKIRDWTAALTKETKTIEGLQKVSSECTRLLAQNNLEGEELRKLCELLEPDIHLLDRDTELTKELLMEIKAQTASLIEQKRSAIQIEITTKIQPEISSVQALLNSLQNMIQSDARLKKRALELPR